MNNTDEFINLRISTKNLDRYYMRLSIYKAITRNYNKFKGRLLDVGCGKMPYRKQINKNSDITVYHGIDIHSTLEYDKDIKPDFFWDGSTMPFNNEAYNTVIATEVFEHCPDLGKILDEIFRVLSPNGILFFTTPFLWPLHEVPHDEYRYTPFSLQRQLKASGYTDISITSTGGWHASLAQILGLWVRRGVSNKRLKKILSFILKPIILFLIRKDKIPKNFNEGQMSTGFYGIAYKSV